MGTIGFRIPFAVTEHFSFTQLLRARDGRDDRVLPVEHQGEHGASISTSPCALALGFTTGRWASAFHVVDTAHSVGGCLTMRQWVDALSVCNLLNPIVTCPSIGFHPPADGEGPAVFVVFEDTRLQLMFKKTCFFLVLSHWSSFCLFGMFLMTGLTFSLLQAAWWRGR